MDEQQPSKTRRKQQMHDLQALGERLARLSGDQLARLELPDALREALLEAKRMKSRQALRRQFQYVGRIMREVNPEPIRAGLEVFDGKSRAQTAWLHRVERWRNRLLTDEGALGELLEAYPGADLQRLRTLVRAAQKEQAAGKPPRSFRAIFDELRTIMPPPRPAGAAGEDAELAAHEQ